MYLKESYFDIDGPYPADDIGQGYLTFTVQADELPPEILEVARDDPSILDQFKFDEALTTAVANEPGTETFAMYQNSEVSFDGVSDCGYLGYRLDIAFSAARSAALVTYIGPGLPSIVRRYSCGSADEAATLWQDEWAEPLIFSESPGSEDVAENIEQTFH